MPPKHSADGQEVEADSLAKAVAAVTDATADELESAASETDIEPLNEAGLDAE